MMAAHVATDLVRHAAQEVPLLVEPVHRPVDADPIDLLLRDADALGDGHVLHPLVVGLRHVSHAQHRDLALACVELALGQNREGELQEGPEALRRPPHDAEYVERRQLVQYLGDLRRKLFVGGERDVRSLTARVDFH
jgi:hypothetical protein